MALCFAPSRVSRVSCAACGATLFDGTLAEQGHCWNDKDATLYKPWGAATGVNMSESRALSMIQGVVTIADCTCLSCGVSTGCNFIESPLPCQTGCILVTLPDVVFSLTDSPEPLAVSADEPDGLDQKLLTFMAKNGCLGIQATFQIDGRDPIERACGFASNDGTPLTPDTKMRIASVSKTITGIACLQLAEQNKLDLDAAVLPILARRYGREFNVCDPRVGSVTANQLLHHLSGGYSNAPCCPMFSAWELSHEELIATTLQERGLEHDPGTAYAYSNFGYCLLGRVIEEASGLTYEEYVQQNIFDKVGVSMASCSAERCSPAEGSIGYYQAEPAGESQWTLSPGLESDPLVTRMDAHGGWHMSASDLVKFSQGIEDGTLLTEESTRSLFVSPMECSGNYCCGCCSNGDSRWHAGALLGTASVLVRTASNGGMSWALVVNSHDKSKFPFEELDPFAWTCVDDVTALG